MKLKVSRSHALYGLYWFPATKEWSLNILPWFGLTLRFERTEAEQQETCARLSALLKERSRLSQMSNPELVAFVNKLPEVNEEAVVEMMNRLDPNWYGEGESEESPVNLEVIADDPRC